METPKQLKKRGIILITIICSILIVIIGVPCAFYLTLSYMFKWDCTVENFDMKKTFCQLRHFVWSLWMKKMQLMITEEIT